VTEISLTFPDQRKSRKFYVSLMIFAAPHREVQVTRGPGVRGREKVVQEENTFRGDPTNYWNLF
jgi:hypothetical protein